MSSKEHDFRGEPDRDGPDRETDASAERKRSAAEKAARKAAFANYLRYSHVGIAFIAGILIFTFGGVWLDRRAGTSPLFLLLGLAIGFAGGLRVIYAEVYGRKRSRRKSDSDRSG